MFMYMYTCICTVYMCVFANVLFVVFWSWSLTSCVLFRFLEIMAEAQAVVPVAPPAVGAQSPGPSSSSGVPASPAKMHPLISRIHPPKKVGDKQMDDDNQSKHHMSIYVINALLQGPEHASGLYQHLMDRQQAATSAFGVPPTELFSNLVNLRNLCLPENVVWLISFLASISDMTKQELMLVKDKDSDNFECLVVFAFQIPLTQRCPDELRIMGVMHRLLTARNNECGTRLSTFKATGALQDDGAIDWKFACYKVQNLASALKVTHFSGDAVEIPTTTISKKHRLVNNHGDYTAAFKLAPTPPVPVSLFFNKKEKKGPWALAKITPTSDTFAAMCSAAKQAFDAAKQAAAAHSPDDSAALQTQLAESLSAKAKDRAQKAREKAVVSLAAKRQKREIKLNDSLT